jgi:diadenosine tetraphosphate (Ap4A) HIT family hydrolase
MTFEELVDFIENKMRMSHVYQPLLIKSLVEAGGTATVRQLANAFLTQDESQLLYYEKRIKEMPIKVLSRHEIIKCQGELVSLETTALTFIERAKIKMLCEQRMQEYVQKRGMSLWDYRLSEDDPVPDSLRYQALKASSGRCALCGATKDERPLDVDHIIPRSRGGKNELSNLQVLCSKCNRSKGNKDATDFRVPQEPPADFCIFCDPAKISQKVAENGTVYAIEDKYPVSLHHTLIVPLRHTPDYFTMTSQERHDAEDLLRYLRNNISNLDSKVIGFNVGANCGDAAGQTIMHAHIHLIPRRRGDAPNPRGGVRGVIPERMAY